MDKLIVIEHMDKVFGNYKAIDDLSFSLEGGKIYGMIGDVYKRQIRYG